MRRVVQSHKSRVSFTATTTRSLTTRGQLNPVHSFKFAVPPTIQPTATAEASSSADSQHQEGDLLGVQHELLARDPKAFKTMITNPGPLRVTYDPNYLDWYYRAYSAKAQFEEAKGASRGGGGSGSSSTASAGGKNGGGQSSVANRARKSAGQAGGGGGAHSGGGSTLYSPAVESGKIALPPTSMRRRIGEHLKQKGSAMIEAGSTAHGMHDLFERQHYFPNIHIDRATDFHVQEMLKEYFLEETIDEHSLWEKALLYRAMLQARKQMYPESFTYIQQHAESVEFTKPPAVPEGEDAADFDNGLNSDSSETSGKLSQHHEEYFKYLVSKYNIENAVEAHVVLQCHRRPDVHSLLFNANNAEDDASLDARFKRPPSLSTYPKLAKLVEEKKNLPLARCLIFGEFNTFVSMDPFVKFTHAREVVSRGFGSLFDQLSGSQGAGATKIIIQRRGRLLQPLTRNSEENIDSRGKDVARIQQRFSSQDSLYTKELLALTEESPELFQADMQHFNPRTVRAEIRDAVSRTVLRGVETYRKGRTHMGRQNLADIEIDQDVSHWSSASEMPLPTVAHFLKLLSQDTHVSFTSIMATTAEKGAKIRQAVSTAAAAMYRMGIVYHKEYDRQVEKQKVIIALASLDRLVSEELKAIHDSDVTLLPGAAPVLGDIAKKVLRLGQPMPWGPRSLEQFGYPSEARMDDYQRWMKKPTGLKPQPKASTNEKRRR